MLRVEWLWPLQEVPCGQLPGLVLPEGFRFNYKLEKALFIPQNFDFLSKDIRPLKIKLRSFLSLETNPGESRRESGAESALAGSAPAPEAFCYPTGDFFGRRSAPAAARPALDLPQEDSGARNLLLFNCSALKSSSI